MGSIIHKNGEIAIGDSTVQQLLATEETCVIYVSCESKFEGLPKSLAIFTCEKLSKKTGREIQFNSISGSSTEENDSYYTIYVGFEAKKY